MPRVSFGSFSLQVAADWGLSSVILAGPPDPEPDGSALPPTVRAIRPFQRNVVATLEKVGPDETPERYVERQLRGLRDAGVSRQEVAPPRRVKVADGDVEGLLTEQDVQGMGGELVRQLQLVVIKDGVAHTIIASHLAGERFAAARPEFEAMLLSFGEPRS